MTSIEAFERFARFKAAGGVTDFTEVTEFVDPDLATAGTLGSTDFRKILQEGLIHWGSVNPSLLASAESETEPEEAAASNFDLLDELRTPKGQLRRQITALREGSEIRCCEQLARRLAFLIDALEDEGEVWSDNSPDSLRQMLLFLEAVPDFRCPTVTVTPSLTFRAQWQASDDEHLALDFLPDGQVRFVVFAPDPRHDRVQRVSGIVSRVDVMRAIEPYKVHRWAADAGG